MGERINIKREIRTKIDAFAYFTGILDFRKISFLENMYISYRAASISDK